MTLWHLAWKRKKTKVVLKWAKWADVMGEHGGLTWWGTMIGQYEGIMHALKPSMTRRTRLC